jgi:hypothetical protein
MCKYAFDCDQAHSGCAEAQPCSYATHKAYEEIPVYQNVPAEQGFLIMDEMEQELGLVRARDITPASNHLQRLRAEFRRWQALSRHILKDDVLNLRIALETTKSVDEFLAII